MGAPRPQWPPILDESFAATFFIGCHAMAGTQGAVRDHTMSTTGWHHLWVNGRPMGEIGLWASVAGHYGVPCVLVSGCDKACAEAADLVPGIGTVVTKRGISRYCALLEPAPKVQQMIRTAAEAALPQARHIAPLKLSSPVEVKVEYNITGQADAVPIIAGRERVDARTVVYRGTDILEAFRLV